MDELRECAVAFERLLAYTYHIAIGRSGKLVEFDLTFDAADFHHLAGLHKLKDDPQLNFGSRVKLFNRILQGDIALGRLQKSIHYGEMDARLRLLTHLEEFLDSNELIFRYSNRKGVLSYIPAEYLLENECAGQTAYLFLASRGPLEATQVCCSLFPKAAVDYTQGQTKWTLLEKVKSNAATGEYIVQYTHPRYRPLVLMPSVQQRQQAQAARRRGRKR